ncbi:MAG: hypothetical protein IJ002_06160 [Clostridia bacterium]|nr:hypothetical protein [Clostridia bacterium]
MGKSKILLSGKENLINHFNAENSVGEQAVCISSIDKNFHIETKIKKDDIRFYSIEDAPFKIYGVYKDDGLFRRLPEEVARSVSEGVYKLHANTAGGRVRFVTDSSYVAVSVRLGRVGKMPHFALSGSVGFDLYVGTLYRGAFIPPFGVTDSYEAVVELGSSEEREITINFPLYSDVRDVYIGISDGAAVKAPSPYANEKPVVYYGSSITQGACASRPGMAYQSIISRRFNLDFVNLGFSGNAKGELTIAEYIKGLDMSAFVYDYDHNSPNAAFLAQTHERMFKIIREAHPTLPIICMSRPRFRIVGEDEKRRAVVEATYKNAIAAGDENVYFLDGKALSALCGGDGMVDGTHPTDYGFASMAKAIGDVLEEIIERGKI